MRKSVLVLCALLAGPAIVAASPGSELDKLLPWRRAKRRAERRARALDDAAKSEKELEEEKEIEEVSFKWTCVVGILALAATFCVGQWLESQHFTRRPEAGVGVLMGMLASGVASAMGNTAMVDHEKFDFEFFMVYLLPPIIFEAGFNMNTKAFVDNIGPTMFYAFIGTFGSTFIVGGIVWYAGQLGVCYPLSLLSALVFGSLISATDPVTVLAVFQALGVKVDLFSMVFGESVLNDAVAIVLSSTLLSFNDPEVEVNFESIMGAVQMFLTIFIGSLIIGLIYGVASAIVFKKLDLRHHDDLLFIEAALSFTFPWAAYYTSEANHFSGIVTILFVGMVMATYTRFNFSHDAVELTARAYKCVALLAETYVFVYLGMAVFAFPIFDHTVWKLCLVALGACFVGRGHIYIGSWMFNCMRSKPADDGTQVGLPKISPAYMFVMWFSGLRGGVAFALASVSYANADFPHACMGLDDAAEKAARGCNDKVMTDSLAMMQVTLLIAAFTIFVFGGAITEVAVAYDVLEPKKKKKAAAKKKEAEPTTAWSRLNTDFIMPFLTFYEEDQEVKKEYEHEQAAGGARFEAAVAGTAEPEVDESSKWGVVKGVVALTTTTAGKTTKEVKSTLDGAEIEMALKGVASLQEVSFEDKIDELRVALPGLPSLALKKLLQENDEDVHKAIIEGQARGFT